jgi:hypothetical protein
VYPQLECKLCSASSLKISVSTGAIEPFTWRNHSTYMPMLINSIMSIFIQ